MSVESPSTAKRVKLSPAPETSHRQSTTTGAPSDKFVLSEVERTARSLGMEPPNYVIEYEDDGRTGFFSGFAAFKAGSRVPDDICQVNSVLGKSECKIQIAQKVLTWMHEEAQRRNELAETLVNQQMKIGHQKLAQAVAGIGASLGVVECPDLEGRCSPCENPHQGAR